MSVWSTAAGQAIEATTRRVSGGGVLPKGTRGIFQVSKAKLETVKDFETQEQQDIVNVTLKCIEGTTPDGLEVAPGRTVFKKLRLWDEDEGKLDGARRDLVCLDLLCCEGQMREQELEIDDENLSLLVGGEICVTLDVWENNGKSGNFISVIEPVADYEPYEVQEEQQSTTPERNGRTERSERTERTNRTERTARTPRTR